MNVAQPKRTYFTKTTHSYVRRPLQGKSAVRTQFRVPRVSTVTKKFPIVDSKFSTVKSTFTADLGNKGKTEVSNGLGPQRELILILLYVQSISQNSIDAKRYWDSGCSRHMTGNISYFFEYEPYDGGYVSFRQGGGKITSKGTKDVASQGVKKDVSSLRYIALPNWFHEAHMESSNNDAQDACNADAFESNGISNPTATSKIPPADQMETLIVEYVIPTISSPVLTACLDTFPKTSSGSRLISKEEEPKKIVDALKDPIWVEAMQEGLLQFKIQNVWILVDYPEFPDRVYKLEKAMYGLHQAPRAWYGTLSKYLLDNGFQRGTIDQTLFIRKHRGDFLLVQVYFDDIIFGSLNPQLCREFEALMHEKFQMSAMGELNFFLGLPDIMFAVCACARHQVKPKEYHLYAVKRIFRYLKGHPKLRLWYPKESTFDLVAYSNSDYGGGAQDWKSTTGGCQFLGRRLISWKCKKQAIVATSTTKAEYVAAA
nr:putative ribonuclease H-like domain-containing protein [Tanacetum cinerariifolium]